MPVTKTAKRALRSSERKREVNFIIKKELEKALKEARKTKSVSKVRKAISLVDRAAKKKIIHKNKSSRIKSVLSKLLPKVKRTVKTTPKTKK